MEIGPPGEALLLTAPLLAVAAVRTITFGHLIAPTRDTVAEWAVHVPSTVRRMAGVPADDVASSLASGYPHFDVFDEASLFDLFDELRER